MKRIILIMVIFAIGMRAEAQKFYDGDNKQFIEFDSSRTVNFITDKYDSRGQSLSKVIIINDSKDELVVVHNGNLIRVPRMRIQYFIGSDLYQVGNLEVYSKSGTFKIIIEKCEKPKSRFYEGEFFGTLQRRQGGGLLSVRGELYDGVLPRWRP